MTPAFEPIEPEHLIEQGNFSLYLLSKKGELKPREEPRVVNDLEGGTTVFLNFEAVPGEVRATPFHTLVGETLTAP